MQAGHAATALVEPTSRYITIDGLRIHYFDWGGDEQKRVLILLHGGGAHAYWWDGVAPQLTGLGRVLALDFRGHGRSQWADPPHYGPPAYIRDIAGLARHLGRKVTLVGHSMGGAVAQWVVSEFPELVDALIIVDSPPGRPPLLRRLQWRWRRRAAGLPRPHFDDRDALVRKFRLSPPGTYLTRDQLERLALSGIEQLPDGTWAFRFDPMTRSWRRRDHGPRRPKLSRVKVPTLILRGADSEFISDRRGRRMQRKIRGSVLSTIPRAYHHVPLDNPDATAAAIIEFVTSLASLSVSPARIATANASGTC